MPGTGSPTPAAPGLAFGIPRASAGSTQQPACSFETRLPNVLGGSVISARSHGAQSHTGTQLAAQNLGPATPPFSSAQPARGEGLQPNLGGQNS